MANASTFSVVISGKLKEGFDPEKIKAAFAALLKVPPEKAAALMRREWVLKKNLDQQTATKYKTRLESIGLIIGLKEHAPPPPASNGLSLSLEPTEEEQQAQQQQVQASQVTANPEIVTCPKCGTEQPKETEQCQGCGVFLHKVLAQAAAATAVQPQDAPQIPTQIQSEEESEAESTVITEENLTGKSIGAGAAAALLGAIVWNIVGNLFNYELGIIAWGIGGAIGFAVAATGGRGDKAAMVCAGLALFAILGGKYMLYSGFKDNLSELVSENIEDVRILYDSQVQIANAFENVSDDESRRAFMIDYEFTAASSPDDITDQEMDFFRNDVEPALAQFLIEQPDFDKWVEVTLGNTMSDMSTMDLLKESFGILDLVFLFLGVGTAFRLGRGTE